IHIDLKTSPGARLASVTPLRIPWINDHRRFRRQNRSRVHMPESPIVEACSGEIAHSCRGVVRVPRLMPDIRVQHSNGIGGCVRYFERQRQIVRHAFPRIADSGDVRHFAAAPNEWFRIGVTAECNDIRRKLKTASPSIQGVMISMKNEDRNMELVKPVLMFAERLQSNEASVFRIIEITRNDQEV